MKSFQKPKKLGYMKLLNDSVILDDISCPGSSVGSLSRDNTMETSPSFDPEYGHVVKPSAIVTGSSEDTKNLYPTGNQSFDDSSCSFFGDESDLSVSTQITNNIQSQVSNASQSKALTEKGPKRAQKSTGFMSKGTSKRERKKPREIGDYTKGGLDNLSTSIIEPLSYSDTPVEEGLNLYPVGFASNQMIENMAAKLASKDHKNSSKITGSASNASSSYQLRSQSLSALGASKKPKPSRAKPRYLKPLQPPHQHQHQTQSVSSLPILVSASSMNGLKTYDNDHVASPGSWELEQSSLGLNALEGETSFSLSLQTSSQISLSHTGSMVSGEILYQNLHDECVRACRSTSASQQLSPLDRRLALQSRHNRSRQQSPNKSRMGSASRMTSAQGSIDGRSISSSVGSDSLIHVGSIDLSGLLLPGEGVNVDGLASTYEPPPSTPDLTDKHRDSHINGTELSVNMSDNDSASAASRTY
jgi:hypothetical protein